MATTVSLGRLSHIDDFVDGGDGILMKYSSLSLNDMFDDIEFPSFNVYDNYIDELKSLCKTVTLTKEEYMKYYQAPKLLAQDVYKNHELDFIIMRLNGIYDPKDFTMQTIQLPQARILSEALSKIYYSNRKLIDTYNENNPVD